MALSVLHLVFTITIQAEEVDCQKTDFDNQNDVNGFLIILCLTVYAIITADKVDIKISVDGKEVFKYNKKDTNEKDAPDDKN